jgi:5-methylcytosine-specific restriction endonuclease McrA
MVKRYEVNPDKHQPPSEYVTRECSQCGSAFEKPGNWRKTHRCPSCAAFSTKYTNIVRQATDRMLEFEGMPERCELCSEKRGILEAHHIVPISSGGGAGRHNVVVLCSECHRRAHSVKENAQ